MLPAHAVERLTFVGIGTDGTQTMGKHLDKLIFRKVRDANLKYNLVEDGDRIVAAMSGGKDSFTMLYYLDLLRKYTPLRFDIVPLYLDLGWDNDITTQKALCRELGMDLKVESTNIGRVVFQERQEKNPCALCSNLRRGSMNRIARELGCTKVALGHHLDDAVHTLFMSILFEGRYRLFKPLTYLDRSGITLIRPLIYVQEREIRSFIQSRNLEPVVNRCPADNKTRRSEVSRLLDIMEEQQPGIRRQFLAAIENVDQDSLWQS
ncbi:MAG TPA: ATP-binding protein [Syntrophomonadaceae bacterium]|nr:ATP-binding protein [Syntrophomonadaceae bacterium]